MEILYMGTGSSEGMPAIFCHCDICQKARILKGKDIRMRSQMFIDSKILIDFPPDSLANSIKHNVDLSLLEYLFITHTHSDHFYPEDLLMKISGYSKNAKKLLVYGSNAAKEKFNLPFVAEGRTDSGAIEFVEIKGFEEIKTGEHTIIPLPTFHIVGETCFMYLVKHNQTNKTILYTHDTGKIPSETWNYFLKEKVICNLISFDGSFFYDKEINGYTIDSHMSYVEDVELRDKMKTHGLINDETYAVLSHVSHNVPYLHEELSNIVEKDNFIVAFDGFKIIV